MIPLEKIERIEKSTQSSWIPGGGMLIEVIVEGYDRVYKKALLYSYSRNSKMFRSLGF